MDNCRKELSIKDGPQSGRGGFCPMRTFFDQGGGVFKCRRSQFLVQNKTSIFRSLSCVRTDKEGKGVDSSRIVRTLSWTTAKMSYART